MLVFHGGNLLCWKWKIGLRGQMVMEPHPEKAVHGHNRRVMGEDGLFIWATLACVRTHLHTCLFVENEVSSMCVTVDFNTGGYSVLKSLIKYCEVMRKFSMLCSRPHEIKKSLYVGLPAWPSICPSPGSSSHVCCSFLSDAYVLR